jgi:pyruvate-ferredoxin/flavodoxin oxidoreductase
MVKGCFDNLAAEKPKRNFVVGIDDDVTHTSISYDPPFNVLPEGTVQCIFWGLGSDGTIGANKAAINTIGMNSDRIVQGYFTYDAFKTDGTT